MSSFFVRGGSNASSTGAAGQQQQNHSPTSSAASRPMSAYSPLGNNNNSAANSANNSPLLQHRASGGGNGGLIVSPPNNNNDNFNDKNFVPVFNDMETHDIVIVAAGDRGLSGAHNQVLNEHTRHGGCSNERERRAGARAAAATMDDDFPNNNNNSGDLGFSSSSRAHHHNSHNHRGHSPEQHFHMEFYAHKQVLGACSVFFRAFFFDEEEHQLQQQIQQQQKQQEEKSPCRRLVVHNVLPASLAHILQSMYGAFSNGTPHDVNLYDPVSLASSPASVIICAWELAMKLELRTCAASIVHILIPLIDEYNSLELLKATTKFEQHELSIVLQRACLHARALPPAVETEGDRKLWQECCCQIPWLSSAVAHLEDDVQRRRNISSHHQQLSGRRRAAELLAQRRKKNHSSNFNNSSRDADDELGSDDDGQRSIGESTQRAWDETDSQYGGGGGDTQQRLEDEERRAAAGVDGLVETDPVVGGSASDNDDEEEELSKREMQRQHDQQQQQQQQQQSLRKPPTAVIGSNNKSRLTPRPLSSVEALCLHNDRTASAQQNTAASTTLSLRSGSKTSQQNQQQQSRPFVPAGSTSNLRQDHQQQHADPWLNDNNTTSSNAKKFNKSSSGATMADALQSRDPLIRVTATRTVLRDAMARSGSGVTSSEQQQQQQQNQSSHASGRFGAAMPPTADLPFHHGGAKQQTASSPQSRSQSNQESPSSSGRFVQRTLPDFEQRFVSGHFGDHRKTQQQQQQKRSSVDSTRESSPSSASHQQQQVSNSNNNSNEDSTVARHKIASLEKDIQNTYDIYSKEMAEYRSVYEALRTETTDLWASTAMVEAGNVPSSVEGAEAMLGKLERQEQQEAQTRAEVKGAISALVAQAEEEQQFAIYAEQFMQAAGVATQELGEVVHQVRQLVQQYSSGDNNNNNNNNNNDPVTAAERRHTMKRAVEIHLDEIIRRLADEDRETEAKLRAHELTLQQLLVDAEEEQRKTQSVKMKIERRRGRLLDSKS